MQSTQIRPPKRWCVGSIHKMIDRSTKRVEKWTGQGGVGSSESNLQWTSPSGKEEKGRVSLI